MDFERARFNMVEQQIRPWDVLDQDVLDLLLATRREDFVSPEYRNLALSDLEVPIALEGKVTGESMLAPKVEGRVLQAVALKRHESALVIGAGSGFMTALIAHRARKVTAVEIQPDIAKFAAANLKAHGLSNVNVVVGDGMTWFQSPSAAKATDDDEQVESAAFERFDVIVFCGGLFALPEGLIARLTPGGRVFVFQGQFPIVQAKLLTLSAQKQLSGPVLFETSAKPLQNSPKNRSFTF
jgi:protein-L-isoaspartate(D-aspartate) O-methyltransferase